MNRRRFLHQSSILLGSLPFFTQRNFLFSEIVEVRDGAYIYLNRGGTILFKLTEQGWVVIDTQFPDQSTELVSNLKKKFDTPIALLVNTHHHGDHTGGNVVFEGLTNKIVAHENSVINQKKTAKEGSKQLYPSITYQEMWSDFLGNERVTLRHFGEGHTNGDSWVHLENANVVHAGDMIFNRRHPFIDTTAGASVASWIEVLERVQNTYQKDTKFVFGHAADGFSVIGQKSDIADFRDYLAKAFDFVGKKKSLGFSAEEVKSLKEFDFNSQWKGDGIQRVLHALVLEIY